MAGTTTIPNFFASTARSSWRSSEVARSSAAVPVTHAAEGDGRILAFRLGCRMMQKGKRFRAKPRPYPAIFACHRACPSACARSSRCRAAGRMQCSVDKASAREFYNVLNHWYFYVESERTANVPTSIPAAASADRSHQAVSTTRPGLTATKGPFSAGNGPLCANRPFTSAAKFDAALRKRGCPPVEDLKGGQEAASPLFWKDEETCPVVALKSS
jgi:hypothetical protein